MFLHVILNNRCPQGGISGNMKKGCCSVVISRQVIKVKKCDSYCLADIIFKLWIQFSILVEKDVELYEFDWLGGFTYTSNSFQGARAMVTSRDNNFAVRVFRSSACGYFAPPEGDNKKKLYRYDGLYKVKHSWNQDNLSCGKPMTFLLERLPKNWDTNSKGACNELSLEELKERIASSKTMKVSSNLKMTFSFNKYRSKDADCEAYKNLSLRELKEIMEKSYSSLNKMYSVDESNLTRLAQPYNGSQTSIPSCWKMLHITNSSSLREYSASDGNERTQSSVLV